jgi:AraC-like DNA-binding protein
MSFHLHQPAGPLAPLVRSIWTATFEASDSAAPGLIAPDALVAFVFHIGARSCMQRTTSSAWECLPWTMLYAQRHACVRLRYPEPGSMVAFRSSAVVAAQLLGRTMEGLWDEPVDLREVCGIGAGILLDRLTQASPRQRFGLVEEWLTSRLKPWDADHEAREALHSKLVWRSDGGSLTKLAASLGLSMRSLRRTVSQSTGLSPKQLELSGRVLRSCALLQERRELDITAIAHALGFSDHAAFANVFREFAGVTPSAFREEPLAYYERGPA